jgi:hypothetical protein
MASSEDWREKSVEIKDIGMKPVLRAANNHFQFLVPAQAWLKQMKQSTQYRGNVAGSRAAEMRSGR